MANLTCDRCLNGDPWRCRGRGKCANADVAKSYGRRTSRSSARKEGVGTSRFKSPWAIDDGPKKSEKSSSSREKSARRGSDTSKRRSSPDSRPVQKEDEISAPSAVVTAISEMGAAGMSPGLISYHLQGDQAPSLDTIEKIVEAGLAMSPSME